MQQTDLGGTQHPRVVEFFAGIGLAGIGLENAGFQILWSNDISSKKQKMFQNHFSSERPGHEYQLADVRSLVPGDLPADIDVAWASFPCTDLSLAGSRGGLHVGASSAFWAFVRVIAALGQSKPRLLAIENVTGFATSRSGRDFNAAIRALNGLGYSVDVVNIDARRFVPQSRPRIFLVADLDPQVTTTAESPLRPEWLHAVHANADLRTHRFPLPHVPDLKTTGFSSAAQALDASDDRWWQEERLDGFLVSLSPLQSERVESLRGGDDVQRRTAFRRMRNGEARWEVRSDDLAGCLRTAGGGSSKQAVVEAGAGEVRVRWMTGREYATLMGVPDYNIDGLAATTVYSGFGDAVCVPVVEWLARHYLQPALLGKPPGVFAQRPQGLRSGVSTASGVLSPDLGAAKPLVVA